MTQNKTKQNKPKTYKQQKQKYGCTILKYAYEYGNENIVKLLIEHGADVTIKDKRVKI